MKKLKLKHRIIFVVFIIIVVSLLSYFFSQPLLLLLYTTIISLFPSEIKDWFEKIDFKGSIRVSYSYLFRITVNNRYLLVKDEQGRNSYHPVGGVYKYNSLMIDMSEQFDGNYDGLFDDTEDTQDDLRLIIKKDKLKRFKKWFSSESDREIISNLSREFKEELIDRNILPKNPFSSIKYRYLGSVSHKSFNQSLKIKQIRHYDIINLKLTQSQKNVIRSLPDSPNENYLFATPGNIEAGYIEYGGRRYDIAEYTKMILIGNRNYSKEFDTETTYSIKVI